MYGEGMGIICNLMQGRRMDGLLAPHPCSASSWCKGQGEGPILLSPPCALSTAWSLASWTTIIPTLRPPGHVG